MNNTTLDPSANISAQHAPLSGYYFIATPYAQLIAVLCALFACAITIHQMYCHLKNYTCYSEQRYIVRLLTLIPAYAICSLTSILLVVYARIDGGYIEGIHDLAEALTIYSFLSLCYQYLGGEGGIMLELHGRTIGFSIFYGTCCFHGRPYTIVFLRFCKIATLQYTLIKPFTAIVSVVLMAEGKYTLGNFSPTSGYLYIFLIDNLSVTLALYGLLLFYYATQDQLKPYSPVLKFITIKSIIFFSFWQGALFSILEWSHVVSASQGYPAGLVSHGYKNLLICVELMFIAVALRFAFPHTPYIIQHPARLVFDDLVNDGSDPSVLGSEVSFKDVREDKLNMLFAIDGTSNYHLGEFVNGTAINSSSVQPNHVNVSGDPNVSVPVTRIQASPPTLVPSISASIRATIDPRDIVADAIHNFSPQYRSYTQPMQEENV